MAPGPGVATPLPAGGRELGGHWLARWRRRGGSAAEGDCLLLRAVDGAVRPRRGGRRLENVLLLPGRPERGTALPGCSLCLNMATISAAGYPGSGAGQWELELGAGSAPGGGLPPRPALRGEMVEGMPPHAGNCPRLAPWLSACRQGGAGADWGAHPRWAEMQAGLAGARAGWPGRLFRRSRRPRRRIGEAGHLPAFWRGWELELEPGEEGRWPRTRSPGTLAQP